MSAFYAYDCISRNYFLVCGSFLVQGKGIILTSDIGNVRHPFKCRDRTSLLAAFAELQVGGQPRKHYLRSPRLAPAVNVLGLLYTLVCAFLTCVHVFAITSLSHVAFDGSI